MAFETFAVHAACIRGVEAIHVTVEVSLAGGVPGIQMLGIPSMEVMESRGRIRCAMRSAGFEIPRSGITVNLAPGDIRKTGSGFDLPIAIAVLAADGQIPRDNLDRCLIAGELGLDGTVLPVKGEVAFQLLARDMGAVFYRRQVRPACATRGRGLRLYRPSVSACSRHGRCRTALLGFRGCRGDL